LGIGTGFFGANDQVPGIGGDAELGFFECQEVGDTQGHGAAEDEDILGLLQTFGQAGFESFIGNEEIKLFGQQGDDGYFFLAGVEGFVELPYPEQQFFIEVVEKNADVFGRLAHIVVEMAAIAIEIIGEFLIEFLPIVFFGDEFSLLEVFEGTDP